MPSEEGGNEGRDSSRSSLPARRPSSVHDTLTVGLELGTLDTLHPGIAKILIDRMDKQLTHTQGMERRGQLFAFVVAMTGLIVAAILGLAGINAHEAGVAAAGGGLAAIDIVALAVVFIRGRGSLD